MDGILIVDKPVDFTSHDVVAKCRKTLRTKKIGHTGTLDPFATGVLVILVGKATRLAQFLDKAEKEYEATVRFGFETDTGDLTGSRREDAETRRRADDLTESEIEEALKSFRGEIEQIPPMYSAKKVNGQKLYDLARKGIEIERKPVNVIISKLEILEEIQNPKSEIQNHARLLVSCSAGTYIRTLAEDIGRKVNVGAHLAELRRTRAGSFSLEKAVTLEKLAEFAEENKVEEILISMSDALSHLPKIVLNEEENRRTANGMVFEMNQSNAEMFADGQIIRLCDEAENLVAIGVFEVITRLIKPQSVFQESNKKPFSA